MQWYERAAEQGHGGAIFNLGVCYSQVRVVLPCCSLAVPVCSLLTTVRATRGMLLHFSYTLYTAPILTHTYTLYTDLTLTLHLHSYTALTLTLLFTLLLVLNSYTGASGERNSVRARE